VEEKFNRQFILLEFDLLDDKRFLEFVSKAEFATYLILRRYIWRGNDHRLGLHSVYHNEQKLASAISRTKIASMLNLKDETRVSKHLSALEDMGLIKRKRTGRETIFILGEWIDISERKDKSKRKEWFYIEQKFGGNGNASDDDSGGDDSPDDGDGDGRTSDVAHFATSDVYSDTPQTWRNEPHNNREENREINTTVNGSKNPISLLPQLDLDEAYVQDTADYIGQKLGTSDAHSRKLHLAVAWRIPRHIIERHLNDVAEADAKNPGALFTHRMKDVARKNLVSKMGAGDVTSSSDLVKQMAIGQNE
jgi:DNA-binding transcriptional ArsR family regulator